MKTFKRQCLLKIKFCFFDLIRPIINLYNVFIKIIPAKIKILRLFGSVISSNVEISGKIAIWDPSWLQINKNSKVHNINILKGKSCYIGENMLIDNAIAEQDMFFVKNKIYANNDNSEKIVTFSLDLEGGVGLCHEPQKNWEKARKYWDSKKAAIKIKDLLIKYNIPAVWGICGHLFLKECGGNHGFEEQDWHGDWFKYDPKTNYKENSAWYMPDLIGELIRNELFEVGYHSFGHFNYLYAKEKTIEKDLMIAGYLRKEKNIKLESIIFPYNGIGYVEKVLKNGFKNLRGYVGQYQQAKTINFGDFKFFYTSECLAEYSIGKSIQTMDKIIGKNFNYFTHPFSWTTEQDFANLEVFFKKLAELRNKGKIKIKLFCNI